MGEVYLAEDTKLDRRVAIKFLHLEFSKHNDVLKRFVREAKAASSLNHPNIITIYEIGKWNEADFIAMEYVEGQSLRDLLNAGKLIFEETLDIVIQTGSALAAAHEVGIVHRDIKPENIMRRPDNLVKVLDFGLAKQLNSSVSRGGIDSEGATLGLMTTAPGFVMGTPAYMSPEQTRGKPADARTDIWSLGIVLYEMVTGELPFPGETQSDMLAAILKSEPPPISMPAHDLTNEFEHIIKKALGKDCDERYQVVKDLILDLKLLQDELKTKNSRVNRASLLRTATLPISTQEGEPYQTKGYYVNRRLSLAAIPVAVLVVLAAGWYFLLRNVETGANVSTPLSSSTITSWKSELSDFNISLAKFSPDGKIIAYAATKNGKQSIWLKQVGGGAPFTRRQDDESEETSPLWSPDGEQIAFLSERGGKQGIFVTPALGGSPVLLSLMKERCQGLVHWSRDGTTIYFNTNLNLYALDLATKQIRKLTDFDDTRAVERDFNLSPDEKRMVYADEVAGQVDLWISGINGDNPIRLTNDTAQDSQPIWHADGERVIYNSYRNGLQQICLAFVNGSPPTQLTFNDSDSNVSDISRDGKKILYTTTKGESDIWGVTIDDGKDSQVTSDIGLEFWQDVSPNGEIIAYQSGQQSNSEYRYHSLLIAQKIAGDSKQVQLADNGFSLRWSPDGNHLAFLKSEAGNNSLWITSATGGDARALTGDGVVFGGQTMLPFNRVQTQDYQWSSDSRSLVYCANREGLSNIWQTGTSGEGETKLTNNVDKNLLFFNPIFSPDGKRIAFLSLSTADENKFTWSAWTLSDAGEKQIFQSDSVIRLVGWSVTGNDLIIKSIDGNKEQIFPVEVTIFQISLDSSAPYLISKLNLTYFYNIQLSPDRKTLAFVTRAGGTDAIQTVPTVGGARKTLISSSDARVYFSSITFAPDGKTLYYGKQAKWQIISMIDNFK